MEYDTGLIVEVSYLYYKCGLKQESVARKLNISRYVVARVLKSALRKGIVQFKIIDPTAKTFKFKKNIVDDFNQESCLSGSKS